MTRDGNETLAKDFYALASIDSHLGLSPGGYAMPEDGFTRVAVVPLSANLIPRDKLVGFDKKKDVVVCMAYYGIDLDKMHTKGVMRAFAIMSRENAQSLTDTIAKHSPGLVYELAKHMNGGPIRRGDGSPAKIKPGDKVEILPNSSVGGNIAQKVESTPFKPGFEPNPLF